MKFDNPLFAAHLQEAVLEAPQKLKLFRGDRLNLASNELQHAGMDDLLRKFMQTLEPRDFRLYPYFPEGVRQTAEFFDMPAEQTIISSGADDAIKIVLDALTRKFRRIILQTPNYENYYAYARVFGISVHEYHFSPALNYGFDERELIRMLESASPSLVVLANPNGFSGFCFSLAELRELLAAAKRFRHLVLIDEAYVPFNGFDHLSLLNDFDNLLLVRSLSKSWGIAGVRLSVMFANTELKAYLERWQPANAVSGIAIKAAAFFSSHRDELAKIQDDIRRNRDELLALLAAQLPTWDFIPSQANFILADVQSTTLRDFCAAVCDAAQIYIRSFSKIPGLESCLRFAVGDKNTCDKVAHALIQAAQEHSGKTG